MAFTINKYFMLHAFKPLFIVLLSIGLVQLNAIIGLIAVTGSAVWVWIKIIDYIKEKRTVNKNQNQEKK